MKWNEGLLGAQKTAASHSGSHALLLAAPGTGKTLTLTRRSVYLITGKGISPSQIIATNRDSDYYY